MGIDLVKNGLGEIGNPKRSSLNNNNPSIGKPTAAQACILQSLNILKDKENLLKLNDRVHQIIPSLKNRFGKGIKNLEKIEKQTNCLVKKQSTLNGLDNKKIFDKILKNFKKLDKKNKLAAFLFIFGSVKGLNKPTIMRYLDQVYESLPKSYKKSIQEIEKKKKSMQTTSDIYLEEYSTASVENVFLKTWNFSTQELNAISMILNSNKLHKIL